MNMAARGRLVMLTTVPISVKLFYVAQLRALHEAGFEVTVMCAAPPRSGPYAGHGLDFLPADIHFVPLPLARVTDPLGDLRAFWRTLRYLHRHPCDIIQYMTPKAALAGALAGYLARVPCRVYMVAGLLYYHASGLKRAAFWGLDWLICRFSTHVVPIARYLVKALVRDRLCPSAKCTMVGYGNACGVDLTVFDPDRVRPQREPLRRQLNIPLDAVVIGAFSRLTGDKGINELIVAFQRIAERRPDVYLLVVGSQEEKDRLLPETERVLREHPRIRAKEFCDRDELVSLYGVIDIFTLPTYREGFGSTPQEAQAMRVPVVVSDIDGCREGTLHGEGGLLVPPRDPEALATALEQLIDNPELRRQMGQRGRRWVEERFDDRDMTHAVVAHRLQLLAELDARRGRTSPSGG
jgi:glycosyltransferase involved in cell wall biosynthesis